MSNSKPKTFVAIKDIAIVVEDFQTTLISDMLQFDNRYDTLINTLDQVILNDFEDLDAHLEEAVKFIIVLFQTPSTNIKHSRFQKAILPSIYNDLIFDRGFMRKAKEVLGTFNCELIERLSSMNETSYDSIVNKTTVANGVDFTITNLIMNVYFYTYVIADDVAERCFTFLESVYNNLLPKEEAPCEDMSKELLIHCVVSQSVNGFNLVGTTLFHSRDGVVSSQSAELSEEHMGKTYQTVTDIISDVRKSTRDGEKFYNSLGMSWKNPRIATTLLDFSKDIESISIV